MKNIILISILTVFGFFLKVYGSADSTQSFSYHAFKVDTLSFDGEIQELFYRQHTPIDKFTQRTPFDGEPATEKSEVWFYYDNQNIYVGANLYDSEMDQLDLSINRKDVWSDTDYFIIYLDTYYDKTNCFYFGVNPGGAKLDGKFFNDEWNDATLDPIWEVKTKLHENKWSVEMKIPISQLRISDRKLEKWGFNVYREIKRKNEQVYFYPNPRGSKGFVSLFGDLYGLTEIEKRQRFELLPYLVQKVSFLDIEEKNPFKDDSKFRTSGGLDFKLGLSSDFMLTGTLNPDFGQVEVDPAQLNLTTQELFYDEKREFFVEDKNLFYFGKLGTNNNQFFSLGTPVLLYSRRIGAAPRATISENYNYSYLPKETQILGALKLSGKLDNSTTVGILSALTNKEIGRFSLNNSQFKAEIEPLTNYAAFRMIKDYNAGDAGVGLFITSVNRDLTTENLKKAFSRNSYVVGLDGWYHLDQSKEYVLYGSFLSSYVQGSSEYISSLQKSPLRYLQRPEAGFMKFDSGRSSLSGFYSWIGLNKQSGNFYLNSAIGFATPGLEYNDLGYQTIADAIYQHTMVGYRWYNSDGLFREKSVYLINFNQLDFDGYFIDGGSKLKSNFIFENYISMRLNFDYDHERYNKDLTRGGPLTLEAESFELSYGISSDTREKLTYGFSYIYGASETFYRQDFGIDLAWKPTSQINLKVSPAYSVYDNVTQYVGVYKDASFQNTFSSRYIFGKLYQQTFQVPIRLNYIITPNLSVQSYFQPYFSVGEYSDFKWLERSKSRSYSSYSNIQNKDDGYTIDADASGPSPTVDIRNPNFNFASFKANVVIRWELLPGSVFFAAWTHGRFINESVSHFDLTQSFDRIFEDTPENVYVLKFSYWINP